MAAVLLKLLCLCSRTVDCCKSLMFNDFADFCRYVISHVVMLFRSFAGYIKVELQKLTVGESSASMNPFAPKWDRMHTGSAQLPSVEWQKLTTRTITLGWHIACDVEVLASARRGGIQC